MSHNKAPSKKHKLQSTILTCFIYTDTLHGGKGSVNSLSSCVIRDKLLLINYASNLEYLVADFPYQTTVISILPSYEICTNVNEANY